MRVLIALVTAAALFVVSCGTEPMTNPGDVRLEVEGNEPYVHVQPPEEPEGEPDSRYTEHSENYNGEWRSYTQEIEYDNLTIERRVTDISYYGWWRNGLVRSYSERRYFEPMNKTTRIEVEDCIYDHSRNLVNYRAYVDGVIYYYGGDYNSDTLENNPNP